MKKHPELKEDISTAKIKADTMITKSLYKRGQGYNYSEITWKTTKVKKKDGSEELVRYKEKEVIKHMPSDTLAVIWWQKNRDPENWRERKEIDLSGHVKEDRTLVIKIVPEDGDPESVRELAVEVAKGLEATTPKALKEAAAIDVEAEEVVDT